MLGAHPFLSNVQVSKQKNIAGHEAWLRKYRILASGHGTEETAVEGACFFPCAKGKVATGRVPPFDCPKTDLKSGVPLLGVFDCPEID